VAKGQRRFEGFDQAIISLYSRGLTTREIEGHLLRFMGGSVAGVGVASDRRGVCRCAGLQNRPLEEVYPIVYFDAIWSKVRESGPVTKVAVYLALGITLAGQKEVLGMWVANSEGASFGCMFDGVKNRGCATFSLAAWMGLRDSRKRWKPSSEDPGAVVSGAYGAVFAELCGLEGAQGGGGRFAADLSRGDGGRGSAGVERV